MNRTVITVILLLSIVFVGAVVVWAFNSNDLQQVPHEEENEQQEGDEEENGEATELTAMKTLVSCLEEKGVVIYGTVTCPFCNQLAQAFGGYEVVGPIYVECTQESMRCNNEMQTNGVPEIQIEGVLYQGNRSPQEIGRAAGCEFEG